MLGWWILIYKQTDYERAIKSAKPVKNRLATWECAVNGISWVEDLVDGGLATKSGDGYPYRYYTIAKHVLTVIAVGLPKHDGTFVLGDDYVLPGGWVDEVTFESNNIIACSLNVPLLI